MLKVFAFLVNIAKSLVGYITTRRKELVVGSGLHGVTSLDRGKFRAELRRGYLETRAENDDVAADWEHVSVEDWPT